MGCISLFFRKKMESVYGKTSLRRLEIKTEWKEFISVDKRRTGQIKLHIYVNQFNERYNTAILI